MSDSVPMEVFIEWSAQNPDKCAARTRFVLNILTAGPEELCCKQPATCISRVTGWPMCDKHQLECDTFMPYEVRVARDRAEARERDERWRKEGYKV